MNVCRSPPRFYEQLQTFLNDRKYALYDEASGEDDAAQRDVVTSGLKVRVLTFKQLITSH